MIRASLISDTHGHIDLIRREIRRKDFWFKKFWCVDLPDVQSGHAILTYQDGRFFVEQSSGI